MSSLRPKPSSLDNKHLESGTKTYCLFFSRDDSSQMADKKRLISYAKRFHMSITGTDKSRQTGRMFGKNRWRKLAFICFLATFTQLHIFSLSVCDCNLAVGRHSIVGVATRYGLDGPGIESQPIPVAELSKARICGRSLAGLRVRIPPGAWMFVLCYK